MSLFRWDVVALTLICCPQVCFPHFSFWMTIYLPTLFMITKKRVVLALCCCSWCFSIVFPCHAGFKYLTKPALIHLSMQPPTTKGDGCFSHLAWVPKKAQSVRSHVLVCVFVLPHSNIFFNSIRELVCQIWWNNKYLKPSKLTVFVGGKKEKNTSSVFPQGKCWSLSLHLIRYQRIYTRRNSKHRPKAMGPH